MNTINLFTQNSKLKKTSQKHDCLVYSFGLPAVKTCPQAGDCLKHCYANKGCYKMYPNVAKAQQERWALAKTALFVGEAISQIDKLIRKAKNRPVYLRIHDSGDFFNDTYLVHWRMVFLHYAEQNSKIHFYFYTKCVELLKRTLLTNNTTVIYSLGGRQDAMVDLDNDRHSRVFNTLAELEANGYVNGSDDDLIAIGKCKKIGLLKH